MKLKQLLIEEKINLNGINYTITSDGSYSSFTIKFIPSTTKDLDKINKVGVSNEILKLLKQKIHPGFYSKNELEFTLTNTELVNLLLKKL